MNISKNLLFLYIISNSTIGLANAEEVNSKQNYVSDQIIWTKVSPKNQKIENLELKEKFNEKKKKNEEVKKSSPKVIEKKYPKPLGISNKLGDINMNNLQHIELKEISDLIKTNSDELKILETRIEENRYLLRSEIASWYPNLNISSTGFPKYSEGNTFNDLSTNTSNKQSKASLNATLKWDLINPSRVPQIELAKNQFEKARIAYSVKFRELLLDAYIQFFNLQKSIQDIRIAQDSIKFSETSLKEALVRKNSGLGSNFDVLEARTQLSKDKQLLAETVGYKKINERKFAQLLNLRSNVSPTIQSIPKIIGLWETSLEQSIIKGYKSRQELNDIMLGISINNNKANIANSSNKPKVSIYNSFDGYISRGEIGVPSPRDENKINSTNTTIGIQFDWPIFDGGYSKAKYSASKEKVKAVQAQLALKKSQIRKEIEESFFKLDIAKESIKNSYDAIESAKESLRLSVLRLKAGITTQREVVNNQRDLTQAEVNHIQALTDYNIHIISLQSKTGIEKLNSCEKKISKNNSRINKKNQMMPSNQLSSKRDSCLELL